MLEKVSLKNLEASGFADVDALFMAELARAVSDAVDRGGRDEKDRKVILEFVLTPMPNSLGVVEKVAMAVRATSKLPPHDSGQAVYRASSNGSLLHNFLSPDNPDQHTLDELERDNRKDGGR